MKEIVLRHGEIAIVDDEDFENLSSMRWFLTSNGYAATMIAKKMVRMHRWLVGLTFGDGRVVDHINGNKLDNRRCNLRICTQSQNIMNAITRSNNKVGLKGVSPAGNRWRADIHINGRQIYLGTYLSPEEAYEVYCLWADMIHGEYSNHGSHVHPQPHPSRI